MSQAKVGWWLGGIIPAIFDYFNGPGGGFSTLRRFVNEG
jgi:hypothetical protein